MWQLSNPTLKKTTLNFEASGLSKVTVQQLWQDDSRLINAIEYVNWQDSGCDFQFIVCEVCGYVGCEPRGWISLRRMGNLVAIMPAFSTIAEAPDYMTTEYLPPYLLQTKGACFIKLEQYTSQFVDCFRFPPLEEVPYLLAWEAAKLFQFEAPVEILGKILQQPILDSNSIVASSEGNFLEQVEQLNQLIKELIASSDRVNLRPIRSYEKIISFYLDTAGFPEWQALVFDGTRYLLFISPSFVIDHCS